MPSETTDLAQCIARLPLAEAIVRAGELRWFRARDWSGCLLDAGCGDGEFIGMATTQPVAVGIDFHADRLRLARERGAHRHLVQGDLRALPFRAGTFSSVVSNGVLEHIPGVDKAMREINRVLVPSGSLAFTVPGERQLRQENPLMNLVLTLTNRIWSHVNLWPPERWVQPEGRWREEERHHYLGPRHYLWCMLHLALGGPWALIIRALTGRKVLSPAFRKTWAPLMATWLGPDQGSAATSISYGMLLRKV